MVGRMRGRREGGGESCGHQREGGGRGDHRGVPVRSPGLWGQWVWGWGLFVAEGGTGGTDISNKMGTMVFTAAPDSSSKIDD